MKHYGEQAQGNGVLWVCNVELLNEAQRDRDAWLPERSSDPEVLWRKLTDVRQDGIQ